jgi:hypothetical protein
MRYAEKVLSDLISLGGSKFMDESIYIDYAPAYAEPGYTDPEKGILFGNWNGPVMKRIGDIAEKLGYEIEWSDEWSTCTNCYKAVRTSPDSYGWTRSFFMSECDITCKDCILEDPAEYIEALTNNSDLPDVFGIDFSEHGFEKSTERYESGFHPGQTDDPKKIAKQLESEGKEYIFQITDVGQFDVHFTVWTKIPDASECEHGYTHDCRACNPDA